MATRTPVTLLLFDNEIILEALDIWYVAPGRGYSSISKFHARVCVTEVSEEARTSYSLAARQLPFLLYAGDQQYIKGFEEVAVGFCNVKDSAGPGNHRKLWMGDIQCSAIGHCDLKRAASANRLAQGICRHALSVF